VRIGKQCFDTLAAAVGLFLLSPTLVLVALLVKLSSRGPVFFRQTRSGRHAAPFQIFKFRSMRVGSDHGSQLTAAGDPRVTTIGNWLRRTKIDELPQLLNVVLGQMSLVGPRPEVPKFTAQYTPAQSRVLDVRPGITGSSIIVNEEQLLAGRPDHETFYLTTIVPAKIAIDLEYCENLTFSNDLYILYQTFAALLIRFDEPYTDSPHTLRSSFKIQARLNERKNN
jgi:lipopolysaccharide/colanic/teichoic acid biosynthesis glycosyltransferase